MSVASAYAHVLCLHKCAYAGVNMYADTLVEGGRHTKCWQISSLTTLVLSWLESLEANNMSHQIRPLYALLLQKIFYQSLSLDE